MSEYSEYMDRRETSTVRFAAPLSGQQEADLKAAIESEPMAKVLSVDERAITVEHNPAVIDQEVLETKLRKLGIEVFKESPPERKKGVLGRWIDKLSEQNKKSLGSGRLDCCDLNKEK